MAQKIKLSTIAESLGLSTATISLALRDSPLVAVDTREKIKEQARALGYIYNRRAASLRTSRSGIIGVVVHDIMNPFYGEILKAIETELDRSRHTFILSNHYDSVEKQRTFIETLLQLGGDGVIMSPAIGTPLEDVRLAEQNGMPAILVARSMEGVELPTYRGDDSYGISLATNHLIGLGHRAIAMIGGTDQTSTGRDRYQGYVDALRKANIEVDVNLRIPGPRTMQGGFEAAVHFLSLPQKPTAAVCWNDLVAVAHHRVERSGGSGAAGGPGAARQAGRQPRAGRHPPYQAGNAHPPIHRAVSPAGLRAVRQPRWPMSCGRHRHALHRRRHGRARATRHRFQPSIPDAIARRPRNSWRR
jgi:DNA-binding LacI/PurR family transcriptional regulator